MSTRKPYSGAHRKLVIGIDIGTTFSGVSFSILDPGIVPVIQGVNRYPAQDKVGGDSKIPSILYYDKQGIVQSAGAEALQESIIEKAADEDWIKVEWFKLHLRPKSMASSINVEGLPSLPRNKTVIQVFGDFLHYLFNCATVYIRETHSSGPELLRSLKGRTEFVLTHPNGWEGTQQVQMRQAAIHGGLIPNDPDHYSRIQFVTEGEASLHYCIGNNSASEVIKSGKGVIILDAGGGTIDLSAYYMKTAPSAFEEIAPPICRFQGSIFVSRRARALLEKKLRRSSFQEDIDHITECFDKSTKLGFRDPDEPSYIKFGTAKDKDPALGIRMGQMKLPGQEVANLFNPCMLEIIQAIEEQKKAAFVPVTGVILVGGFSASDWLFSNLQKYSNCADLSFSRPDGHLGKAVAEGAVSFYLDHFVSVRVARTTYGTQCFRPYEKTNRQHVRRYNSILTKPSGTQWLPNAYDVILPKGTRVSETTEFRRHYSYEGPSAGQRELTISAYRGHNANPQWVDEEHDMFSALCTVAVDLSQICQTLSPKAGLNGEKFYQIDFSVILLFGLTEHKAQLCWMHDGKEKRGPVTIVYDQGIGMATA